MGSRITILGLFFLLFSSLIHNVSFSQGSWIQLSGNTDRDLNSIKFFDDNTGIAVGNNGVIVITTNSGYSWDSQIIDPEAENLNDICITSSNSAIIVGENGTLLKTNDRGALWDAINSLSGNLTNVEFFNENEGIVISSQSWEGTALYKTIDGGDSWSIIAIHPDYIINGAAKANDSTIYFAGQKLNVGTLHEAAIFRLGINDGELSIVATPTQSAGFFDIDFNDQGTGYAVGAGHSSISKDGGLTWNNSNSWSRKIELYSDFGLAASDNLIWKTTNAGETWSVEFNNQQNFIKDIIILNENRAFAVGLNGTILTNNPVVTNITPVNSNPDGFSLEQNYPNPFNPSTTISFTLLSHGYASLKVYDLNGKLVKTLVDGVLTKGNHIYSFEGIGLSSGIYLYTLETKDFVSTKRMTLIK